MVASLTTTQQVLLARQDVLLNNNSLSDANSLAVGGVANLIDAFAVAKERAVSGRHVRFRPVVGSTTTNFNVDADVTLQSATPTSLADGYWNWCFKLENSK